MRTELATEFKKRNVLWPLCSLDIQLKYVFCFRTDVESMIPLMSAETHFFESNELTSVDSIDLLTLM